MDYLQYKPRLKSLAISYGLKVLNLIIDGLPSIPEGHAYAMVRYYQVLNLIIDGLPSIL